MISMWKIPDVATLRTPAQVLREQAVALHDATEGKLHGQVESSPDQNIVVRFKIIVPSLNFYSVTLCSYGHDITQL